MRLFDRGQETNAGVLGQLFGFDGVYRQLWFNRMPSQARQIAVLPLESDISS